MSAGLARADDQECTVSSVASRVVGRFRGAASVGYPVGDDRLAAAVTTVNYLRAAQAFTDNCPSCRRTRYECAADPCTAMSERQRFGRVCGCGCGTAVPHDQAFIEFHDIPRTCGCGCGTPINQRTIEILKLKKLDLTFRQIADRLGCTHSAAKAQLRQLPRYAKGHAARAATWVTQRCRVCGREFRISVPAGGVPKRDYCAGVGCPSRDVTWYWDDGGPEKWDEREAARNTQLRANTAATSGRIISQSRATRLRLKRARQQGRVIPFLRGEQRSTPSLEEQLATAGPEIRELVAEQAKDARREQIQYAPSLDDRLEEDDDGSWAVSRLGAVCFDREDDEWAYRAARGRGRKVRAHA